jgi:ABC-type multidrug transport system fused ATPase/permease subunit
MHLVPAKSSTVRGVISLLRQYPTAVAIGLIFLIAGTLVNLALPALARELLNNYGISFIHRNLGMVGGIVVVLFALQGICFYGRTALFGALGQRVASDLRSRLFEATILQPISFFDSERTADLVSRLSSDTILIQDAVSIRLSVMLRYGLQVMLGAGLMAFISLKLTLVVLSALILLVLISMMLGSKLRRVSRAQQAALGASAVIAEESFGSARIVKAFNQELTEIGRFQKRNTEVLNLGINRSRISAFFQSFVSFLLNSSLAVLILYGVVEVFEGGLPAGDLTAFLAYGAIVAVSFSFIAGSYAEIMQAVGATERVFEILSQGKPLAARGEAKKLNGNTSAELVMERVGFAYPSRPEAPVLHDVELVIPSGKKIALVGPSGAGKSTIVNLLLRFYDPITGRVTLNGVDLRDLDPTELRRVVSYVPQEPDLFGVSIAENLRYGKSDATEQELLAASQKAGITEFIESLPNGFQTIVGERGAQLSGGQKQRVAIARAILRNPQILILDEATSALDSENEALVQGALSELLRGRSALIIAHRLSTIRDADLVVVLDGGRIVQTGTHEQLCSVPGLYSSLVQRQELKGGV